MVGIPLFAGFASKYYFALSAAGGKRQLSIVLTALAISMILNAIYFIPTVISIWSKPEGEIKPKAEPTFSFKCVCVAFMMINFILGIFFQPIVAVIEQGLRLLG